MQTHTTQHTVLNNYYNNNHGRSPIYFRVEPSNSAIFTIYILHQSKLRHPYQAKFISNQSKASRGELLHFVLAPSLAITFNLASKSTRYLGCV